MDSVTLNAYAKINLFLEIRDKRPDSYHNIESIMTSVSLADTVTVSLWEGIKLKNDSSLPNDRRNLAYRASELFFEETGIKPGAYVDIKKRIPVAAGLAGGSSDAAAVLKALNVLYGAKMTAESLCRLGAKLGADVPFCIRGGAYVTKGIGDVFSPCPCLPDCYIVVSKQGEGVSTPFAYAEVDRIRKAGNYEFKNCGCLVDALKDNDLSAVSNGMYNAFEEAVCPIRPYVDTQKKILIDSGAVGALMSGSGPSVFGLFDCREKAEQALSILKESGADAHLCAPVLPEQNAF